MEKAPDATQGARDMALASEILGEEDIAWLDDEALALTGLKFKDA